MYLQGEDTISLSLLAVRIKQKSSCGPFNLAVWRLATFAGSLTFFRLDFVTRPYTLVKAARMPIAVRSPLPTG